MSAQQVLQTIDQQNRRPGGLPEFRAGDSVKVWAKIREGEKTRLQAFEGVCIRRVRKGARSTFTVRKISYGVGVERQFPDNSPNIERVEIVSRGKVHQARLFYLRDLSGKAARIKERGQSHAQLAAAAEAREANAAAAEAAGESDTPKVNLKGRGKRKAKKDARAAAAG
jgi:large subunit ribosomal protein L19